MKHPHVCLRCGYNWQGVESPTQCPNCESPLWDRERKDRRYVMQKIRGTENRYECVICGQVQYPLIQSEGKMPRGYRFCVNGCLWPVVEKEL